MDASDIISIILGTIGFAFSVVALFQSRTANQHAEDANRLSDAGNRLASHANDIAQRANKLAFDANQIAEDANKVAHRTFDTGRDQTAYGWRVERYEQGRLTVLNDSIRDAFDVSVAVRLEGETIASGHVGHLPAFHELPLEGELAGEEYTKRSVGVGSIQNLYRQSARSVEVELFVGYTTELGVVRDDHVTQAVSQ